MNHPLKVKTLFAIIIAMPISIKAQTYSSNSNFEAQPVTDCIVPFSINSEGVVRDIEWGADEAWMSEENLRRCLAFMGQDNVEVVRVSYQPTSALVDDDLSDGQKDTIAERIRLLGFCNENVKVMINCDHPTVHEWYSGNAERWAQLIDISTAYYQEAGANIVSIAPFNEPDYIYHGEGDLNDFYNIASILRTNPRFDTIRICGGNVLNCDNALYWYNALSPYLDEGNTHQLAGSFDSFASFFTQVRDDGNHATDDEMHNVMEAMVGLEYGLQTGIWWGAAEYARGEFCKASHGERLAYAEHRDYWTAASVYRSPEGKVQAFGGMSERQSVTTTYRFLSKDRDVFYNGYGPQREFVMELIGGEVGSYQNGQTNAEQVVNITWGEDVQPVVDGTYLLVNKNNKKVLTNSSLTPILESYSKNDRSQQWRVNPIDNNLGGDFSYYQFIPNNNSAVTLDVLNYSLDSGAEVILYTNGITTNEQWYLEYAGDGWFRIRNRHSSLCLASSGTSVIQSELDESKSAQLWRFLPTDVRPRIRDIDTVTILKAVARPASIFLAWSQSDATDPTYTVLRSDSKNGDYEIIARNITDTVFIDNKVVSQNTYYYKVKVVDSSVNSSEQSEFVQVPFTGDDDLVAHYEFENNANDTTWNINHAAVYDITYEEGYNGQSAVFNGSSGFVQLPTVLGNLTDMTIATWVYWSSGSGHHLIDFSNGQDDEYMYLSVNSDNYKLRFGILGPNDSEEQYLQASAISRKTWTHVALTISSTGICLYVDGNLVASTKEISTRLADFQPLLNYIGRSHSTDDTYFKGNVDDFRIYNIALTADEIATLANGNELTGISLNSKTADTFSIETIQANSHLNITYALEDGLTEVNYRIYDLQGRQVIATNGTNGETTSINVASIPSGLYILEAQCGNAVDSKKVSIRH